MLRTGASFPPSNIVARNKRYLFEEKLFRGTYNEGVQLEVTCVDSSNKLVKKDIPYSKLTINKFKLYVEKVISLFFGVGDFEYKCSTLEDTQLLRDLVERTRWVADIKKAIKKVEINGNVILRTSSKGADAIEPYRGFKIVDKHDKGTEKAIVIFEVLESEGINRQDYVRVELHAKGYLAERVYEYSSGMYSGVLGRAVNYEYRGRVIKSEGNFYEMPVKNVSAAEWITVDDESDISGVYGISPLRDFKDLVFKLEELMSIESMVIETNSKPLLAVASKLVKPDEKTGGYKLSKIDDIGYDIIPLKDGEKPPQFVNNANAQLEHSAKLRESLEAHVHELMEMNKAFISGEYGGNVSDETLNTIMKGCIDRAERHWWNMYYKVKNSLYCLAALNGLDIDYEDIEVIPNIGLNENKKELAEISGTLIDKQILSRESIRMKYYGMTKEQSKLEDDQIREESGIGETD